MARSNVRPTLPDAVAGDLTAAMPYRTLMNIIKFIEAVDKVVPGFVSEETLLYGPEIKFYSNKVKMDEKFNTNIEGLPLPRRFKRLDSRPYDGKRYGRAYGQS